MENSETIVINKRDLNSPYIEEMLLQEKVAKRDVERIDTKPVETSFWLNPVFYTACAGLLGAFIGWLLCEPELGIIFNSDRFGITVMIYAIPALIGCFVSSVDSLVSGNSSRAIKVALIGFFVSTLAGFVCGIAGGLTINIIRTIGFTLIPGSFPSKGARFLYEWPAIGIYIMVMARTAAWTIVGVSMGIGPGIALKSKKLLYNGIIGGVLGGFLGGLFFDPICILSEILKGTAGGGALSRIVGFGFVGVFTGIFIGLIENIAKEAWVKIRTGALRGKNFIMYHDVTVIGSSPRCDIYIFKDPKVEPMHAEIRRVSGKYQIVANGNYRLSVNGKEMKSKYLENNDLITVGESSFEFHQKESA